MTRGPVLLTIVVISKDDPRGLERTLRSIEQQSFRGYEVVVVAKGTSVRFDAGVLDLPRLVPLQQASAGISEAFNEGIRQASGEWINFLNGGDSYTDSGVLERLHAGLASPVALVTARAQDRTTGIWIPRDRTFAQRNLELVAHQASFFRRDLFERHGLYSADFRIRMDFEWMLRLPRETAVLWLDDVIVDFEGGGISTVQPVSNSLEELRALRRHHRGLLRIAALLGVYLPMRVARHLLRKLGWLPPAGQGAQRGHA
jgi:glycosyltransferase involved in cell wall biosynthesis